MRRSRALARPGPPRAGPVVRPRVRGSVDSGRSGGLSERPMDLVLKTSGQQCPVGSNPTPSAKCASFEPRPNESLGGVLAWGARSFVCMRSSTAEGFQRRSGRFPHSRTGTRMPSVPVAASASCCCVGTGRTASFFVSVRSAESFARRPAKRVCTSASSTKPSGPMNSFSNSPWLRSHRSAGTAAAYCS